MSSPMPTPSSTLLGAIMSRGLSSSSCKRILLEDGVTSPYLRINSVPGISGSAAVDVRATKKSLPEIAEVASAAKNLDEYQFLVCSLVPSLPDSDAAKLELQKYRVAILAAFARLVVILNEQRPQELLGEWSRNARWLVEETSDAYLQAKSGVKTYPLKRKELFDYFGVPEPAVISALRAFYGQQ